MMLGTTAAPYVAAGVPAFSVTAHGVRTMFYIDDDAFESWMATEGDELVGNLPDPNDDYGRSALSDLAYAALSAGVLVGDPAIELNVHNHGAEYLVRLNNLVGGQPIIGLTIGQHKVLSPANDLSIEQKTHYYLRQICNTANALLTYLVEST